MTPLWCTASPGGLRLALQISANARKTEVIGVQDGALKLKLAAQPVDGKANEALIKYLSKALGVPRSALTITHGQSNKKKLIDVASTTLTPADAERLLNRGQTTVAP